jgi:hypothetical protein
MNLRNLWPFKTADGLEKVEPETTTLHRVEWKEEETTEYDKVTRRLVWSGGYELEITYIEEPHMYGWHDWVDAATDYHGQVHQDPAYSEEIERVEGAETETTRKTVYAWVSEVPPGVEKTGKTKKVIHKG